MSLMRHRPIYIALIVLFVLLAAGLTLRKQPDTDEGWFFSPIHNYLTNGTTGTTIMDASGQPWSGVEKYTYWQVPFWFVAEAAWMKIFGLSLAAMRSLSIVAGLVCVLLWISFFRLLRFESSVVTIAAVILMCDYVVVTRSAIGRMDMLSAAFCAGALTAYLKWREDRFTLAIFLCQSCLALSLLSHPMGGITGGVAFLALFIMNGDWRRIRFREVALTATPYAIGFGLWGIYISHDVELFRHVFGSNTSGRLGAFASPLKAVWGEIYERYLGSFGLRSAIGLARAKLVIPVVYIGAAIAAAVISPLRQQRPVRTALLLLALGALVMMLTDNHKFGIYLVHVIPMYAVLLASLVVFVWRSGFAGRVLAGGGVAGFVALQLLGSAYWIRRDAYHKEFQPVANYMRQHAAARIDAPAEFGFAFGFDGAVKDDVNLGVVSHWTPAMIVQNDHYREWLEICHRDHPEQYRSMTSRLQQYRAGFASSEYVVLLPKEAEQANP